MMIAPLGSMPFLPRLTKQLITSSYSKKNAENSQLRKNFTEKSKLVKFTKKLVKKRQPTWLVNVTRFAIKRYGKQHCVTVTLTS